MSLKLVAIGVAEIVYNLTRDGCPGLNWAGHPGDMCDSMPTAWHNPLSNTTRLVSAVNFGEFASVGPSLDELSSHHECSHAFFKPINDSRPETYNNHQWFQAPRVFSNGSGFAMIHNEFHGEQPPHNASYCSFKSKQKDGNCILWSTDLAETVDGGATWEVTKSPLFTLPRRYLKDAAKAGYGELGTVQRNAYDGMYYGVVSRSYRNGTGAGPAGTEQGGTCVFRSANPLKDPDSFRGWNGTEWSTLWINPYQTEVDPEDLWKYTCADIDVGGSGRGDAGSSHWNIKRFALPPDESEAGAPWPTHVMTGLPGQLNGKARVSYAFPPPSGSPGAADSASAFTKWSEPKYIELQDWISPHWGETRLMYPVLLDHASPFTLSAGSTDPGVVSDGLSYALIGNKTLFLYFTLGRSMIARVPVAWIQDDAPTPEGPFQPLPPLQPTCVAANVSGAGLAGVDGVYYARSAGDAGDSTVWEKDETHQLYCYSSPGATNCLWELAHHDVGPRYYEAHAMGKTSSTPPGEGWKVASDQSVYPAPTISCAGPS